MFDRAFDQLDMMESDVGDATTSQLYGLDPTNLTYDRCNALVARLDKLYNDLLVRLLFPSVFSRFLTNRLRKRPSKPKRIAA